ncbi:hypothetical protein [Marinitenerispora sediminis]|uniref:Uncharacterized protein n=1 Tax=Marinitenerispora sediminis TaxID=1931232 RepID=A0A368T0F4_9ACTN|nr:hypothetical protein [Marinitenerispora sediminis]RCV48403.1 hypothetical protein DEF28_23665 [Marinitenerispora sediminis]RCV50822.1 hypothetical protein DEF23_21535 [Marinitenerispora sediminis]RCV52706.1 hypothetical protein DEF24_21590 [Marinitenerispora sediminis]
MGAALHPGPRGRSRAACYAEVAVPGAAIGLLSGAFAGGVASLAGLPAAMVAAIAVGLGAPLALFGGLYCVLLAAGRIGVGAVGPVALLWLVGFPLSRLADEFVVAQVLGQESVLREPLLSFLLFQAMLSLGYAIGFLWLHERLAPRWLLRITGHNDVAATLVARYVEHVSSVRARPRRAADRGR